jgi:hypothetical protein
MKGRNSLIFSLLQFFLPYHQLSIPLFKSFLMLVKLFFFLQFSIPHVGVHLLLVNM